ncbi:DUF3618 domain-containing protein [Actinoalloteichus hymeniacidonis]|uniref:DUF3618 family protein n=1 Tax=Actinoalloteichus hymeniacidonis TaxID=340345 RepID=A0AAC9HN43_9PSEU|nr:DUF3618 domain-containing protein [Actinoalloteichus hymeniacidonis]AOS62246.1 putative DUF3618 family protein [Actinoalloteichus hymeniacidonis]MBB5909728.1 hypothetical protein [Actinoalloteichus hymeniacidonis]
MARHPEEIERDIEQAREALAVTLDELGTRAHPRRFVESAQSSVLGKFEDPKVRISVMVIAALIVFAILRKLFR